MELSCELPVIRATYEANAHNFSNRNGFLWRDDIFLCRLIECEVR